MKNFILNLTGEKIKKYFLCLLGVAIVGVVTAALGGGWYVVVIGIGLMILGWIIGK